jgi:hypothetical protein
MDFSKHIIINAIFGSLILFIIGEPVFSRNLLIIVLTGLLIDIDHVLDALIKGELKHPKKLIKHWISTGNKYVKGKYVFHTIEFIILILILSFAWPKLIYVFIGLAIHLIADCMNNYLNTNDFLWLKDYSLCFWKKEKILNREIKK